MNLIALKLTVWTLKASDMSYNALWQALGCVSTTTRIHLAVIRELTQPGANLIARLCRDIYWSRSYLAAAEPVLSRRFPPLWRRARRRWWGRWWRWSCILPPPLTRAMCRWSSESRWGSSGWRCGCRAWPPGRSPRPRSPRDCRDLSWVSGSDVNFASGIQGCLLKLIRQTANV